ncbi:MAG: Peptidase family protein [Candidatus Saccharibacteria bacterium]|nr:Peptidase family protein [Candidatus Saccharibacteria bacterium]
MKATKHKVTHVYQPTNNTCGYAALAILLSHYGKQVAVDELLKVVPHPVHEDGQEGGSITPQLAAWALMQGFQTHMYSFDCLVLDLSWKKLSEPQIVERLKAVRGKRDPQVASKHYADEYIDAYLDMLKAGGKLTIQPFVTTKLLYKLLEKGPVYANICSTARTGEGRNRNVGLRKSVVDDVNGTVSNHSIVLYGNDTNGNFLVADPWEGMMTEDPETMICAITAAQIECDNMCFVIE